MAKEWVTAFQHDGNLVLGMLRRRPDHDSTARGTILPQEEVRLADDEYFSHEFVNVKTVDAKTSANMVGDVKVSYIQWVHVPTGCRYGRLTDKNWFERDWTIDSNACSIRVSEGGQADIAKFVKEAELLGMDSYVAEPVYADKGYTYASLEIGKPYSKKSGHFACNNFHITLAYAATMGECQREDLKRLLEKIMKDWMRLPPLSRPPCLPPRAKGSCHQARGDGVRHLRCCGHRRFFSAEDLRGFVEDGRINVLRDKDDEPFTRVPRTYLAS